VVLFFATFFGTFFGIDEMRCIDTKDRSLMA
jgi:hypothetical protein